ncbi:hypothetical protein IDH44_22140 [Paenibacillus sp. IB182496]|uniref:Uncharacterized protein n=1 Tax=Paenibacillus sabuli TaxID=2772509 RepID=A0A927GU88_9BACL|nr:hypothetical protein [Paenibacillus sabuli]MBD2847905.1 hypothetical protein [Paenibacillus sabuli]
MRINPVGLSLFSSLLIIGGFVLYVLDYPTYGVPLLVVGLCISVFSAVLRWVQTRK